MTKIKNTHTVALSDTTIATILSLVRDRIEDAQDPRRGLSDDEMVSLLTVMESVAGPRTRTEQKEISDRYYRT